MELRTIFSALMLSLLAGASQAQVQTQSTINPNVPVVGALVEQSGPLFRSNWQAAVNDINALFSQKGSTSTPNSWTAAQTFSAGNQVTGAPDAIVNHCLAIQVTTCGIKSTWGPAFVPFDIDGLVTVDTLQGGLQVNNAFGFLALYQGTTQQHNFPGWALTLNNDTTLSLYYSAVGFLAPITFTGSISGTTLTVTSIPFVQPLGIGHVLSGAGVTGGTTILAQLTGSPGFNGTYQVSVSQTVGSETISANPGQPLVIPQQWSPNYTWLRANCHGVLPDSIATVNYMAATAMCWNFNNVGETDFFNDPGTPGAGTFAFVWNDYNHTTHTTTQLMNMASASNSRPGAVLFGGNGAYPNNGSVGQINVNAGSNNNIEVLGSSVSNTSLDSYYNGPVLFWQLLDATVGNTVAIDMRGFNTNKNSFGSVMGQVTASTASTITGNLSFQVANAASYANQQALKITPTYVQFGSNASTFVAQVPEHIATAQIAPPALTSCGTSPAIAGTDTAGTVTMGTGNPTGCVITFNAAYAAAPYCVVTWIATPLASQSYAVSNAAITLTQTATSSNKMTYHCMAQAGG